MIDVAQLVSQLDKNSKRKFYSMLHFCSMNEILAWDIFNGVKSGFVVTCESLKNESCIVRDLVWTTEADEIIRDHLNPYYRTLISKIPAASISQRKRYLWQFKNNLTTYAEKKALTIDRNMAQMPETKNQKENVLDDSLPEMGPETKIPQKVPKNCDKGCQMKNKKKKNIKIPSPIWESTPAMNDLNCDEENNSEVDLDADSSRSVGVQALLCECHLPVSVDVKSIQTQFPESPLAEIEDKSVKSVALEILQNDKNIEESQYERGSYVNQTVYNICYTAHPESFVNDFGCSLPESQPQNDSSGKAKARQFLQQSSRQPEL